MRKFMLASTVVLFIVGQTMGASTVGLELELGGSNNGATCTNRVYFTPGGTADGVEWSLDENGRLTWALRIHAMGTHLNASQQEVNIRGVANFVFDLELYHDSVAPGNLVTTATFMSTANEAMTDCGIEQNWSNAPAAADFLSNAAFAYAFNLNSLSGPARAIDWWAADANGHKAGGLRMDVRCYPKVAGDGLVRGMGAGYSRWNKPVITERSTGGLGRPWGDDPVNYPNDFPSVPDVSRPGGYVNTATAKLSGDSVWGWLGYGPVCEGQIEDLQEGVTYILRVVPGGGINVVRNEATSYTEVFAIAADTTVGDDIVFTVDIPDPPVFHIVGWSSIRDCGGVSRAIALNPTPVVGELLKTETRKDGVQKIQIDFDADVTAKYTAGQISLSNDLNLVSEALINGGQSLLVTVSNSQDGYCYTIDISGAVTGLAAGEDTDCVVQVLAGDVNGDGVVSTTDMAFIKSKVGASIEGNERFDVTCDGNLSTTDMAYIKSRVSNVATCF